MKILKGYVKNQYRPEASIIKRYIANNSLNSIQVICQVVNQLEFLRINMKVNVKARVF